MSHPIDPAKDGAQMRFDGQMSYGDYLSLDSLLTAQTPRSDAHDEMLFIIQHQTSELWMRLVLHELHAARKTLQANKLRPAFKMLSRVARIFEQLNNAGRAAHDDTIRVYQLSRLSRAILWVSIIPIPPD